MAQAHRTSRTQIKDSVDKDSDYLKLQEKYDLLSKKYKYLHKQLEETEKHNQFAQAISREPRKKHISITQAKSRLPATAVVVLTDWHAEENVDPQTINGLNEYNLQIAEKRISRTFQKAIYLLEASRVVAKIDTMVLALLGDLITGHIHEELAEDNHLSPTEATLFVQDMLATGIDLILEKANINKLVIPCCYGNHGRTTKKPRCATGYKHSYEWLLYQQLSKYYQNNPKITFSISKGYHNYVETQGRIIRFHHGDGLRYQGGVGGISIPVNKSIAQWNKGYTSHLDVFGHWHQFLHTSRWISCPTLMGYNAWALNIKAEFEEPAQVYFVLDEEHGVTEVKKIFSAEKPSKS